VAKAIPNPETPWGDSLEPRGASPREHRSGNKSGVNSWDDADLLPKDQERSERPTGARRGTSEPASGGPPAAELQAENNELRSIIAELQQELESASGKTANSFAEKQKEYESLLDEKTELIRELHVKLQELEDEHKKLKEATAKPPTPKEEELMAMSEELERERCQFQQERRQLDEELRQFRQDSEAMNQEMRQMEVQMARERADLARQRTELQRISEEIHHELERIERDRGLSERLEQLRQRHLDTVKGRGGLPPIGAPGTPAAEPEANDAGPGADPSQRKDSGLLRRFFK
jgi:myosin heavy subunit